MEHRRFSRVQFNGPAFLEYQQQQYATTVLDLSLKGALVEKPLHWPLYDVQQPLLLTILLDELAVELHMQVEVAHQHGNVLGLHCLKMDIDTVSHLRRLLELNLGSDESLNREIDELSATD
ncbi:PilZ domain-containing protein [Chromatiaceae bacterium AAb-1]|jgi:hypothetical protein|nr:PilZ domain-containing protein [Chromatiaceae bacterium AAb-1]